MRDETLYRYRARYSKEPEIRFIGHLDLMRTWERTLRRAQIPVAYTEGFHPHQRINLGAALPLSFSSNCELIDFWLLEEFQTDDLSTKIINSLPPGITLHSMELVELEAPSLQKAIRGAEYQVELEATASPGDLVGVVEDLLSQGSIQRERRGKTYDLRPLIEGVQVNGEKGSPRLTMRLSAMEDGTGRPDEVLRALGLEPERARIERTRLILAGE